MKFHEITIVLELQDIGPWHETYLMAPRRWAMATDSCLRCQCDNIQKICPEQEIAGWLVVVDVSWSSIIFVIYIYMFKFINIYLFIYLFFIYETFFYQYVHSKKKVWRWSPAGCWRSALRCHVGWGAFFHRGRGRSIIFFEANYSTNCLIFASKNP